MKKSLFLSCLLAQVVSLSMPLYVLGQAKDLSPVKGDSGTEENKPEPGPSQSQSVTESKAKAEEKPKEPIVIDFTKKDTKKAEEKKSSVSTELDKKLEGLAKKQVKVQDAKEIEAIQKTGVEPASTQKVKAPSVQLFGRIEQISKSGSVKMPVLKAMTAKMDPRGRKLQAKAEENKYSGTVTSFFPRDFQGTWGGQLQIWSYHWSQLYLKFDRQEAIQSQKILKKGRKGNVNFVFYRNSRGRTSLKPAEVLVSIPMKDSYTYNQMMNGSNKGQMAPFGDSFQKVMGNMEMPMVKINFGNFQTDGVMVTGVSGNEAKQRVVKNVIRQLAPNVLEQQIITRATTKVKGTNRTNTGYAESVLRFKKLGRGKMYVLAATVNYTSKGGYLDKLIMYGYVNQGKLVQTNPMGSLNGMMGNMMNLQKMFGMPTGTGTNTRNRANPYGYPGRGQMQGLPKNFNPNDILKRMNQQMGR